MEDKLNALRTEEQAAAGQRHIATRVLAVGGTVSLSVLVALFVFERAFLAKRSGPLPASFELSLAKRLAIDPQLIRYHRSAQVKLPLQQPRALATGLNDRIYVAGDRSVHIFSAAGGQEDVIALQDEPHCLAVGGADHREPGRLYVGTAGGVEIFDAGHVALASWQIPRDQAVLTSIAVGRHDVFVADAGNRVVWRFTSDGEVLGEIGKTDPARQIPGFVISSAHFDIAIGAEGLLHIVNPGLLQIAAFTFDGDFGGAWGRPSASVSGFFGCCNPVHIALRADGKFVTSEKGIPRIKIYGPRGDFQAVVAGPQQLDRNEASLADPRSAHADTVFDIAVDSHGRVLALDSKNKTVFIFVADDDKAAS
jgi:hypothetical protein